MRSSSATTAAAGLLLAGNALAIDVQPQDASSVKDAAKTIAANVMSLYEGDEAGNVPGLFPSPYYFWESGLAWDSMIYYAATTGDDQYNDKVHQAMTFQVGPNKDYMPPNQTKSEGNDDQSYWALAAMTAEEYGFPAPDIDGVNSWMDLAKNVFDDQVQRWDNGSCGGGLRWQIYSFNSGWDYKNVQSNGNFMQLAARLYASTKNETYANWFNTTAEWLVNIGLVDSDTGAVYDGASTEDQCKALNHLEWTANTGTVLAAYNAMVDRGQTSPATMLTILKHMNSVFVTNSSILTEPACLPSNNCNVDQLAFRAVLARALVPFKGLVSGESADAVNVNSILSASAKAAGAACSDSGCGANWSKSTPSGSTGLSQDLSALNVMLANLPTPLKDGVLGSGNGTATSNLNATSASGTADSSASPSSTVQQQQQGNGGVVQSASTVGLLSAVGFAVALFQ